MNKENKGMFSSLKQDLPASIVVFFVAVPLCLGIALASGAPLFSGLIAGIIGGIVVGAISNSQLGVSGPAAGLAIIVLHAIQDLGAFETFLLAVIVGGIIQVLLGVIKGGIIGYYFPSSVIKGMLAAIGIIIFLKQIPHAFGYDRDYEGDLDFFQPDGQNTFSELINMLNYISPSSLLTAAIALFILLLWDVFLVKKSKVFKIIPGPLVAVLFGIFYQLVSLKYFPNMAVRGEHLVSVPVSDGFSSFFSNFTLPDFSQIANSQVWVVGFTIAIVASLETLLCVEATDKLDPEKRITDTNRELYAQGFGNIISGLIGGLPITQVIVRSSANLQSGGKSKLSAILHGVLILVCVAFIPSVLNLIPLSVLASVLLVVGFKLAKPQLFKQMYKTGWEQFIPFIVTVVAIVATDLLMGIGIGMATGVFFILRTNYRNSSNLVVKSNENEDVYYLNLSEEVTFLNKAQIAKTLDEIPPNSKLIINGEKSVKIAYDVKENIEEFKNYTSKVKNIDVEINGIFNK